MREYKLKNVFQVECDVMIYVDLTTLLPIFQRHYPGMAAVFQNDILASVGFLYFSNIESIAKFTAFITSDPLEYMTKRCTYNDMHLLGGYRNITDKEDVDHLPILPKNYAQKKLLSRIGQSTRFPQQYYNHIDEFNSIFDADYLGIYLNNFSLGIFGNQVLYNANHFKYCWERDEKGRKIPYLIYEKKYYRINTLHIFHKNLRKFISL